MNETPKVETHRQPIDIQKIESFLLHEAHLLDERRFEEWMELFTEDGYYWAPARPDQASPLDEVSLFFDDVQTMNIRIKRLRHPRIHVQTPHSRTARLVSNTFIEEIASDRGEYTVRSKFIIFEFRPSIPEGEQRVLGGTYRHRLIEHADSFKIAWKKALLANCDARFSPLLVYF